MCHSVVQQVNSRFAQQFETDLSHDNMLGHRLAFQIVVAQEQLRQVLRSAIPFPRPVEGAPLSRMQALMPKPEIAATPQLRWTQVPLLFAYLSGICLLLTVLVSVALLIESLVASAAMLLISVILLVVVPLLVLATHAERR